CAPRARTSAFGTTKVVPLRSLARFEVVHFANLFLFVFRGDSQPEDGCHAHAGDVLLVLFRIRQIQRLAILATIDFPVRSPSLCDISAILLDAVAGIEPALQVATANLVLLVFQVAGALMQFLDAHLVVGNCSDASCGSAAGSGVGGTSGVIVGVA